MREKLLFAGIVATIFCLPLAATAQTDPTAEITALQAQINQLLAQIDQLTGQTSVTAHTSTNTGVVASPVACPVFTRSLFLGMTGSDVADLQSFLAGEGFFNAQSTGFFGPLTLAAVQKWQAQNGIISSGDPTSTGWGVFGPMSRGWLSRSCKSNGTNQYFTASPTYGQAPLSVTFTSTSDVSGTINFGDGQWNNVVSNQITHTYDSAGTYTASLYGPPPPCATPTEGVANCSAPAIGSVTITVTVSSNSGQTIVSGHVTIGGCPAESNDQVQTCSWPYQTSVAAYQGSNAVMSTLSDSNGFYQLTLAPGAYTIRANSNSSSFYPRCNDQNVNIAPGSNTVDISCDNGIR